MPLPGWSRSFYWRIATSFVVLVVVVLLGQSFMFSYMMAREGVPFGAGNPNATAAALAAAVGAELARDAGASLDAVLRREGSERGPSAFVVLRDGRVFGPPGRELSVDIRRQAEATLAGVTPVVPAGERPTGPVVSAPIQLRGELHGLVVLPPPPQRGVFSEVGRLLSLPGTLVLLFAAATAAIVIFAPARRRLQALESAAERLGSGDLAVRAPEDGRDEIANVAAAFNRMASELTSRTEALQTSDALRRQMLADVSHELRTPLTAMSGFLDTLVMPNVTLDSETRTRYLETVRHETERLKRIVADLLDLAKHENGVSSLEPQVFAIERVFSHVIARHEQEAAAAGVTLLAHVAAAADQLVADPDRIEQAIGNLVANAVRHTPRGGSIDLRATATAREYCLSVVDSGQGIDAAHVAHVFERFYKLDTSRAAGAGGSGLGLSIVKAIVERHGGAITVNSRPGQTAFVITLPQTVLLHSQPH